jgi:hypothetical protein
VTCAQAFDPSNGSCDEKTFGTCSRPVAGIPCCTRHLSCDKGVIVDQISCNDSCAQGCSLVTNASDCVAYACTWFVGGCPPAPPGVIEGPACVGKIGSPCVTDDDCADDERCKEFWIDPCAGSNCDACGGTQRFCTVR